MIKKQVLGILIIFSFAELQKYSTRRQLAKPKTPTEVKIIGEVFLGVGASDFTNIWLIAIEKN